MGLLARNRQQLNRDLPSYRQRRYFSPAAYSADRLIEKAIRNHARGALLDVGCGDMPYRDLVEPLVERYDTLDYVPRTEGVTYMGDAQAMTMIADAAYDAALCLSVIEHLPNPSVALSEIARVLKPGGRLVLSAPHLSRLHEEPHDYYRFTHYGLRHLLEQAGFQVIEIAPAGGVLSFLGHQAATLVLCALWRVPIVKWAMYYLLKWLWVLPCAWLDRLVDRRKVLALGYVATARKLSSR